MQAVVYQEKEKFVLTERARPALQEASDAIVRVTLSSICTSDLHILHGSVPQAKPGVIVGHEMVGVVCEVGAEVSNFHAGDRVSVNVETFCGKCFYCRRGFVNNCTDTHGGWALGCRIDGGQCAYVRVPFAENGLNHIPETVSDEQALLVGDVLATGYWAAKISAIKAGDTVVVIGAGPVGICAMQCCALYAPAHITAVDLSDARLRLAREHGHADRTVNVRRDDLTAIVAELTDGRGADVVIEAAGGEDTFQMAWQIARPNGLVCLAALYEQSQTLPLPRMYGKNLTFKTGGVDASDCDAILRLIAQGKIDTTCLITQRYPLAQIMEAYALFAQKREDCMKIAIYPD